MKLNHFLVQAQFVALFLFACATAPEPERHAQIAIDVSKKTPLELKTDSLFHISEEFIEKALYFEAEKKLLELISLAHADSVHSNNEILKKALFALEEVIELRQKHPGEVQSAQTFELDTTKQDTTKLGKWLNKVHSLNLKEMDLPIVLNDRVVQQLDYLTQRVPSFVQRSLNRKTLYDSLIYAEIDKRKMPRDLIYLALVESGYKTNAYSSARAGGIWQFIPATGRRYGLNIDWWVDLRRDPLSSTRAALSYLQDLHNEFGDWLMTMAAYNCGEGRIRRRVRQGAKSYWEMKLPRETMYYVPRILAATIIGHAPEKFGFTIEPQKLPETDSVSVQHCLSIELVAKFTGTTEKAIQNMNPSLRRWCTPSGMNKFVLYIPKGKRSQFLEKYDKLDKTKLTQWHRYKVKWGDNLGLISRKYGLSVRAIKQANRLRSSRIRVNQSLVIPIPESAIKKRKPANKKSSSKSKLKKNKKAPSLSKTAAYSLYQIKSGDTYFSLAKKHGVSTKALLAFNGTKKSNLNVGDQIKVPLSDVKKNQPKKTKKSKLSFKIYKVKKGENAYRIAKKLNIDYRDLIAWNDLGRTAKIYPGMSLKYQGSKHKFPNSWYIVKKGDSFWSVSSKLNMSMKKLKKLNPNAKLVPGMKLKIK